MNRPSLVFCLLFLTVGSVPGAGTPPGPAPVPAASPEDLRRVLNRAGGRYEAVPDRLRWERLTVGARTYTRARVRSFDTWNAVLFFDRGIVTVPLARLPEDARRLLGHDDAHPPAPPPPPVPAAVAAPVLSAAKAKPYVVWRHDPVARALIAFGSRPVIRREVDLRPDFEQMGLTAKNQGESPSCAVYAVTAALEYHRVMSGAGAVRLSEAYLYWASLRSIGRTRDRAEGGGELNYEGGLGLTEVVQSLRSYGIPAAGRLPATFNPLQDTPAAAVQEEAWANSRVGYIALNGRTKRERLEQAVLALNEGLPVVIGMLWPESSPDFNRSGDVCDRAARAGYGHAVLLTGYACTDGVLENTVFRFRNSYGEKWGDRGYGTVPWDYLLRHGYDGLFLDVR